MKTEWISSYLPYNIQAVSFKKEHFQPFDERIGILTLVDVSQEEVIIKASGKYFVCKFNEIKLILKPLSLLKNFDKEKILNKKISIGAWEILLKNHYDVYGLIDKGEALSIETKKPPFEGRLMCFGVLD